ncbi:MAG: bacillithiol biosynthesis cysteine-adding enzyme BshC [Deltaproteobacteria bacterium]|nr:bacillithiol biosynthesis cysteine-adding enzyme BshC [Deltaproteobacteria bacterium]
MCPPPGEVALAPRFTEAWLAGRPAARALLPLDPWCGPDRAAAVREAVGRSVSAEVLAALTAMDARATPSDARRGHLDALARGGAAAVLTGQQAGLWLGPLYTFYKAAHAVCLARWLSAEQGVAVVPVFWVASEDHDHAEAAECGLPGDGAEPLRVRVAAPDERPVPMACRTLGPEIAEHNETLRRELDGLPAADEVLALVERHYAPGVTWAAAFTGMLAELFADEGLLVLDPRDPHALAAALPVHRRAFAEAEAIAGALEARVRELRRHDFDAPVHVRPGAPLSFVHPEGPEGPRYRVEAADGGYALVGGGERGLVPAATVEAWLASEPWRFSSSALLRPLVQDLLLPTAATVGGPGELAYLAQTTSLYTHFGRPMPLLAPRARFRVVGPREQRLCAALGLEPDDAALPRAELLARVGATRRPEGLPAPEGLEERLLAPVRAELLALRSAGERLDRGLAKMVTRGEAALEKRMRRLANRYRRALAQRDSETIARLDRLVGALAPGGAPQERVLGLPALAAREGLRSFKARVLAACEPFPTRSEDIGP